MSNNNENNLINYDSLIEKYEEFVDTLNEAESAKEIIKSTRAKKATTGDTKKKSTAQEEIKADENLIGSTTSAAKSTKKSSSMGSVDDSNLIGSRGADRKDTPAAQAPKAKAEKVAIFSDRNVTWGGVGKVYRGYNIVTEKEAEQWLTRNHVRMATPEEVAREFGK
jgi:hypothetical protein